MRSEEFHKLKSPDFIRMVTSMQPVAVTEQSEV
jgi:hypothetical protein